jgi:DNA repair protein RadC
MSDPLFTKVGRRYRPVTPSEVCERATQYVIDSANRQQAKLTSPREAKSFLAHMGGVDHEQFGVIYMDNRHRVIKVEIVFEGTIDGASVHPREIVKRALQENAAAVMFFHNHPSGIAEPSQADERITHRLKDALALLEIRTIDHLIIGGTTVMSMAERGLL